MCILICEYSSPLIEGRVLRGPPISTKSAVEKKNITQQQKNQTLGILLCMTSNLWLGWSFLATANHYIDLYHSLICIFWRKKKNIF